ELVHRRKVRTASSRRKGSMVDDRYFSRVQPKLLNECPTGDIVMNNETSAETVGPTESVSFDSAQVSRPEPLVRNRIVRSEHDQTFLKCCQYEKNQSKWEIDWKLEVNDVSASSHAKLMPTRGQHESHIPCDSRRETAAIYFTRTDGEDLSS